MLKLYLCRILLCNNVLYESFEINLIKFDVSVTYSRGYKGSEWIQIKFLLNARFHRNTSAALDMQYEDGRTDMNLPTMRSYNMLRSKRNVKKTERAPYFVLGCPEALGTALMEEDQRPHLGQRSRKKIRGRTWDSAQGRGSEAALGTALKEEDQSPHLGQRSRKRIRGRTWNSAQGRGSEAALGTALKEEDQRPHLGQRSRKRIRGCTWDSAQGRGSEAALGTVSAQAEKSKVPMRRCIIQYRPMLSNVHKTTAITVTIRTLSNHPSGCDIK
jgi:hypothetical protein